MRKVVQISHEMSRDAMRGVPCKRNGMMYIKEIPVNFKYVHAGLT